MSKKFSISIIISVFLVTCLSVYFTLQLKFNYDFDSFFPKGNDELEYFEAYKNKFENDNDFLLLAIKNEPSIYDSTFLKKIDKITKGIEKLQTDSSQNVVFVKSITNTTIDFICRSAFKRPIIHTDNYTLLKSDSTYISQYKDFKNLLFSEKHDAVCLLIKTKSEIKRDNAHQLLKDLEQIFIENSLTDYHLAGKIKAEQYYMSIMETEIVLFIGISAIFIIIFLILAFRSMWGLIIPLFVVQLSVLWSLGLMGVLGKDIDIMTILMPTIMFIVGISDVVHILSKYLDELRYGSDKMTAIKTTLREVGLATLLTSVTTSIGFVTLMTSSIKPVRDFGIITAVGVMMAFIIAFTLIPAILSLTKPPQKAQNKQENLFWFKSLHRFFFWIIKNKLKVLIGSIALLLLSAWGIYKIEINVQLIDEVSNDDPLKKSFLFMEEKFGGARPFELHLVLKDSTTSFFDTEVLEEVQQIHTFLEKDYGINNIISPLTVIKNINRSLNCFSPEEYIIPDNKKQFKKLKYKLKKLLKKSDKFKSIMTNDGMEARLTGRMNDIGSRQIKRLNEEFYKAVPNKLLEARITGSPMLIDKSNDLLSFNMLEGLAIAFGIIAVIMGILYKSLRITLIALFPNILPLVMIGGYIGFMDIGLKISTSIIFTIAFGIAVDDTIHFMSKLKLELMKGKSLLYATKRTFISTGKAIIITSCVLVAGFGVLIISTFNSTFYIGLLISFTLLIAVLADLMLIPVLLIYFYTPKKLKNKELRNNPKK